MARLRAFGVACLIAAALVSSSCMRVPHVQVEVPSICTYLSPDTWLYSALGCDKDSAGGGGSGAS